jgi:hypothetical protein
MPADRMRNGIALAALIIAAVVWATPSAFAQRAATTDSEPAATQAGKADATPSPSGQQAAADSKSSPLREVTRAEAEVLIEGMKPYLNTSIEGLKPVHHDNGAVSIDLEGRFQSVSIAKIEADGTIRQACVTSEDEARQFLLSPTANKDATSVAKKLASTSTPATAPTKPVLEER